MLGREKEVETTPLGTVVKDIEFDPYRSALTDRLKTEIEEITLRIRAYEERFQTRQRRRKAQDEIIFKDTISALISDLIYRYLHNPEQRVYLRLSNRHLGKKSRYRPDTLGKTVPSLLKILSSCRAGIEYSAQFIKNWYLHMLWLKTKRSDQRVTLLSGQGVPASYVCRCYFTGL